MSATKWVRRIAVRASQGGTWTVALSDRGEWGCSCPKWRFAKKAATGLRPDCHHIIGVKGGVKAARPQPAARAAPLAAKVARGPELDLDAGAVVVTMEVGARFRYLDFDLTVTA